MRFFKKNFYAEEIGDGMRWEGGVSDMKAFLLFSLVWLVKKIVKQR